MGSGIFIDEQMILTASHFGAVRLKTRRPWSGTDPISSGALSFLRDQNEILWGEEYWQQNVRNHVHFNICAASEGAWSKADLPHVSIAALSEFKFAYETHFWAILLNQLGCLPSRGTALELMPGRTYNIPVALESLGFRGTLARLDLSCDSNLSRFSFVCKCINDNFLEFAEQNAKYDLIIGNHLLDDLIMYLHLSRGYCETKTYSDFQLSISAWRHLIDTDAASKYTSALLSFFFGFVTQMSVGTTLILREYPSTFELRAGDMDRTRYIANLFRLITSRICEIPGVVGRFVELEGAIIPLAHRYPNSVFVARKL